MHPPATADDLAAALAAIGDGRLVVITGAGISLASGIPTFRGADPHAVWKHDVTELGTWRYFRADPVASWRWYMARFDQVLDKRPNHAHRAVAALERWLRRRGGDFLLVTQNIDTLHEQAGSQRMVKVHGSADRVRCIRTGCRYAAPRGSIARAAVDLDAFRAMPSTTTLPRCPACDALLRQHVLWFDECYEDHQDYQWSRVLDAATTMDLALFVGTSLAVGVTELFLRYGVARGVPVWLVDPGAGDPPHPKVRVLRDPAEALLPTVCAGLGAAD